LLLSDYFGSFVSYYNHFKKIGHDVKLVIGNDALLEGKWLKEHGIRGAVQSKYDIVLRQVEEFKPDVFFIGSMFDYYGKFLARVSKVTRNIFAWIACPYSENLDFTNIVCIISSAVDFVAKFRKNGLSAEVLDAAFDSDIIQLLDNNKTIDVSFIGGLSKKTHRWRVEGLEYVAKSGIDLKTFGYGLRRAILPFLSSPLQKRFGGELWGLEMYKTLNNSRVSLNFHIDVAKGFSGNMRLYEATGCGTLLMNENTPDLNRIFRVGKEVVVYNDFADLVKKINYYLAHDEERSDIARAGQKACIENHGYAQRIVDFEKILFKYAS
jgi:glycosyltransferase involved in cell wall biosynthesis